MVADDLVALSDAEDEEAVHSADGEDIAALLSADEGNAAPSTSQAAVEKKRKRRESEAMEVDQENQVGLVVDGEFFGFALTACLLVED